MPALSKILIANRGEIACRVIRAASALGYRTVAVYSEADSDALHVRKADQAIRLGPSPPRESYLNIERIIEAARRTGADAIHPGYGFLAENAAFARRCQEAGVVFIGPPPEAIALMGDKVQAKLTMQSAGVPVIPGYLELKQDEPTLVAEALRIGYPLLVKAVAGGGGRGMRLVRAPADLPDALSGARLEAQSAFGNGDLLLEKLIEGARHVEIQVFADSQGNALHLFERDCSTQRRHQKIIEECPSPAVDEDLRQRMGAAAVAAARAIGYVGAGTVEFLLDDDGQFYFLEMNTRLQVEHPVTEMVTGIDLVHWQLIVAEGQLLPRRQEHLMLTGHAIEARIYAEDPYASFLPQTGRVLLWHPSPQERVDAGIVEGDRISPHYDPLLGKIITWGLSREVARRRLIRAVEDSVLLGVVTNRRFLLDLLRDEAFIDGRVNTATIDGREFSRPIIPFDMVALAGVLQAVGEGGLPPDVWRSADRASFSVTLEAGGDRHELLIEHQADSQFTVTEGERRCALGLVRLDRDEHRARVELDGLQQTAHFVLDRGELHLELGGLSAVFVEPVSDAARTAAASGDGRLLAPISGQVVSVRVAAGDAVTRGQCVAVLESMKIEHSVLAGAAGIVDSVAVSEGDQVAARQVIATLRVET